MAPERSDGNAFELVLRQATGEEGPVFDSATDFTNPGKIDAAVRRAVEKFKPKAREVWEQLVSTRSEYVRVIEKLARETGIDILTVFAQWIVQRELFLAMGKHFRLERAQEFLANCPDCVLALTRHSSIVTAGSPDAHGFRDGMYVRIDARKKGWEHTISSRNTIADLRVGEMGFVGGVITTPIECLLVLPADRSAELEEIRDRTVTSTRRVTEIKPR